MTIALWCVLATGLLPYVAAAIAKVGKQGFDNYDPRAWLAQQGGFRARANAAQLNTFETFPLFAAAVIIAHMLAGPQTVVSVLALVVVFARVLYVICYITNSATLRSVAFAVGFFAVIGIFVAAA